MILRRKSLRNKSPKSKVLVKKNHTRAKKLKKSRLSQNLKTLSSKKVKPALNSGNKVKVINENISQPKKVSNRNAIKSLSPGNCVKSVDTTKKKENHVLKQSLINISFNSLPDKHENKSITSPLRLRSSTSKVSRHEIKKKKESSQKMNLEEKIKQVTKKEEVINGSKKNVPTKKIKGKTNCKKYSLSDSNLTDISGSYSPHKLRSSTSRNSLQSVKCTRSNSGNVPKKTKGSLRSFNKSKTSFNQSTVPICDLVASFGDESYNCNAKQDRQETSLNKNKSITNPVSSLDDLLLCSSFDDSRAKLRSSLGSHLENNSAKVKNTAKNYKISDNSVPKNKSTGKKTSSINKNVSEGKLVENFSDNHPDTLKNIDKKSLKDKSSEKTSSKNNSDMKMTQAKKCPNRSAVNKKRKDDQAVNSIRAPKCKNKGQIKPCNKKSGKDERSRDESGRFKDSFQVEKIGKIKKSANRKRKQSVNSSNDDSKFKDKEPTKGYTKKSKKCKSSDESVKCNNDLSSVQLENTANVNKSKRSNSSPIQSVPGTSSKTCQSLRKFKSPVKSGLTLKYNVPFDDLTSLSISTPSTIEKLFTNNLNRKRSATSTPAGIRKNVVSKISNVSLPSGITGTKRSLPAKGSLKRKRWLISSLKEKNEGYEDDLFENCSLKGHNLLLDESDFSDASIATPKCAVLVTPNLPSKTPIYRDCYSPTELFRARKVAEEYIHRRNKKRKGLTLDESYTKKGSPKKGSPKKGKTSEIFPEKQTLELASMLDTLSQKQQSLKSQLDSDEEEDVYFSDVSF